MAGGTKWRTRRLGAVLFAILIQVVNGYEESYTISQISPKSQNNELPQNVILQTSLADDIQLNIEPSAQYVKDSEEYDEDKHIIVPRSAVPDRESRSINIDEIPSSNNNEIDNELELHHKRKYYEIHPTRTIQFYGDSDEDIVMSSEGFGDRFEFRFPGEGKRVPKARALTPPGPKIRPTAVQPTFATQIKEQGRQNTEIQNIITGIVKLLNGNVNVQANAQLLNGRPGRPMNSRINNRGPPRISDVPPPPDFDKPITPPNLFHPTKTPPPYPFDRPPHVGVNLPEQIVPPLNYRPGFTRPIPPWQRPKRPPTKRPLPNLSLFKPTLPPLPQDLPDSRPDDDVSVSENETSHENNIHHDDKDVPLINLPEVNTEKEKEEVTTETSTSTTSTTTTSTTTQKPVEITTEITTEKPTEKTTEKQTTTTEKMKIEKPKLDKEKKKDDKNKNKVIIETPVKNNTIEDLESSITETTTVPVTAPTPTEGLNIQPSTLSSTTIEVHTATTNSQPVPIPSTQSVPYQPFRPRPGLVLDDPDFKPHGSRYRPEASVITAPETGLPGYGETFAVVVSAIQGPGGKEPAVHIQNVNPLSGHVDHDDIIVSASGDQGFVSIDGKRTYLNLFDSTGTSVAPTKVQTPQRTVAPRPTLLPGIGTGEAVPADDTPVPPRPQQHLAQSRPPFRRPQPTVRIDTCIVGDDSTCDEAQNEKCRTESGISSCQCRPGYARRNHRDPCRRVVSLLLNLKVDRLYDRKVAWDSKLADRESDPYHQLNYEAVRAIDSAFSMTPFSDEFVSGSVNSVHRGDHHNRGVFVNFTILIQESAETLRSAIASDIQKHLVGVLKRRSNNVGKSHLWVDSPDGSILPLTDLDECSSADLNDCHRLATCTNTWGGFRCKCPDSTLDSSPTPTKEGRKCSTCANSHCNDRGVCKYAGGQPYCSCSSGYYGSTCDVDGEVVGVAVGASLAAALVIALTLAALLSWSRKWSKEQRVGMGSPVFNYMAANTVKTPPVGQPPYQWNIEERLKWAQMAEAMAHVNHYAQSETPAMATRPSSALFGGYPTLPPVPMPRLALHHASAMNTLVSRPPVPHHNIYGYTNHMATESTSSEASSHVQDRTDLLMPRPKSRARSMHNQTGIYYDVEYENAPEPIYGSKGIPLSTYTVSRGPPFYNTQH